MSTVLLLVVLAGWIGVGFWWFVTHRGAPSDAILSFKRQLGTLERRTPGSFAPAHSLRGDDAFARRGVPSALRRSQVQKRRRDIFGGLVLASVLTFALGFLPHLRILWVATLVSGALLASYCWLLVQLKAVAAEREMQVRFRHNRAPGPSDGTLYAFDPTRRPTKRSQYQAPDEDLVYAYARNVS